MSVASSKNDLPRKQSAIIGSPEPIAALNKVRILEYSVPLAQREHLVDVRKVCLDVELTERVCPFLRSRVAEMLNRAQAMLPQGHRLRVSTCLRTYAMQKAGWDKYFQRMRDEHPEWPLSSLRRATNKYFAPYDQPAPPGHCTGAAIDVNILGPDGEPLDVLGPTKGWEAAYTWSDKIGTVARANRMMMVEAMLNAGFSNCRDEYWHYSWGDSAWAVRTGVKECPYGWVYPPVEATLGEASRGFAIKSVHTVRDEMGVPVRGEVTIDAESEPHDTLILNLKLDWAGSLPITVHIAGVKQGAAQTFFQGDGESAWEPLAALPSGVNSITILFSPTCDRAIVTNQPTKNEAP